MAEEKKNVAGKVDKASTDAKKAAAEKVAKAAKGSKKKDENKENIFVRAGKTVKRFFKDFRGESKKIVWPDGRTVLKSSIVVIVVVALVALVVLGIDTLLAFIIQNLQSLAEGSAETTAAVTEAITAATTEATTAATEAATSAAPTAAAGMVNMFSLFG